MGTNVAALPNRCLYTKANGTQCGSPAVRQNMFCYFHKRLHEERIVINQARARRRQTSFELPILEDAGSIQLSLGKVMRQLANGQIDAETAGLLIYALQTATTNLRLTNFHPSLHNLILDPGPCEPALREKGKTASRRQTPGRGSVAK